jgi:hypothetical protein
MVTQEITNIFTGAFGSILSNSLTYFSYSLLQYLFGLAFCLSINPLWPIFYCSDFNFILQEIAIQRLIKFLQWALLRLFI